MNWTPITHMTLPQYDTPVLFYFQTGIFAIGTRCKFAGQDHYYAGGTIVVETPLFWAELIRPADQSSYNTSVLHWVDLVSEHPPMDTPVLLALDNPEKPYIVGILWDKAGNRDESIEYMFLEASGGRVIESEVVRWAKI
jgi:hypothetical protein